MPLYPLKFEPIYKEKVWGGRSLEKLGRALPADRAIGESWELVDLATTSASGGGGGAEHSIITNGPLAGKTISDVIAAHGTELLGRLPLSDSSGFPLLVKYLDANEHLSVQVHPNEAYAAAHADAFLKSEAWYIVDAEPGAVIYKGVRNGVTAEQFRAAIENNTVEDLVIAVPVEPGQMHYLPSGTCHALGAGILVAEVQTPSDTTFRVYDWGRTERELHVEQALQCIHFGPADTAEFEPNTVIESTQTTVTRLVRCEHFIVEKTEAAAGYTAACPINDVRVWMVLAGRGELHCEHETESATPFGPGDTLLLAPALDEPRVTVDEQATWLEISFPAARGDDVIA